MFPLGQVGVSSKDIQKARQMAKRKRSSVACSRCKMAKLKCSDYRPCKQCSNFKTTCQEAQGRTSPNDGNLSLPVSAAAAMRRSDMDKILAITREHETINDLYCTRRLALHPPGYPSTEESLNERETQRFETGAIHQPTIGIVSDKKQNNLESHGSALQQDPLFPPTTFSYDRFHHHPPSSLRAFTSVPHPLPPMLTPLTGPAYLPAVLQNTIAAILELQAAMPVVQPDALRLMIALNAPRFAPINGFSF